MSTLNMALLSIILTVAHIRSQEFFVLRSLCIVLQDPFKSSDRLSLRKRESSVPSLGNSGVLARLPHLGPRGVGITAVSHEWLVQPCWPSYQGKLE